MKSITNTQSLSASARVIQVIKWTLGVRKSYPRELEVLCNWNLITPITRALHYLGDQIGYGIKSILFETKTVLKLILKIYKKNNYLILKGMKRVTRDENNYSQNSYNFLKSTTIVS